MEKLSSQDLIRIRRVAEDAAYAMNRNYKPFVDEVTQPLNVIALVDMAQNSHENQTKANKLQTKMDAAIQLIKCWREAETYSDDCANMLEKVLLGEEV